VGPSWTLLTGKAEEIRSVQRAFGIVDLDKNTHRPLTFLRPAGSKDWVRFDGFAPVSELAASLKTKVGSNP